MTKSQYEAVFEEARKHMCEKYARKLVDLLSLRSPEQRRAIFEAAEKR